MAKLESFDLYYLERYPAAAADTFEGQSPADVAIALGETLNDDTKEILAAVVAEFEPQFAASCIAQMPNDVSSKLLGCIDDSTATAMLRGSQDDMRKNLLSRIPESRAQVLDRRLKFAANTVGAFMDAAMPTYGASTLVSTCLSRLRKQRNDAQSLIVLTDTKGYFAGAVTLARVVVSNDRMKLRELVDTSVQPLQQNMPIDAAADSPSWRDHATLPVVNSDEEVVGELTLERLTQVMSGAVAMEGMLPPVSIIANLGHAYMLSLQGFMSLSSPNNSQPGGANNE